VGIKDALLPEYDHEMGVTRRLLERLPEQEFGWRPHEKSRSLGALATHLAHIPTWTQAITEHGQYEIGEAPSNVTPPVPATLKELLQRFDANVAEARRRLDALSDAELMALWTFKKGGHVVFSMPRIAALRSFLMNHSVHHRGQLSVYLRLRNVPLPAMYGPTADEG
jgi:uncharacterized damage-inducible protein DinB